MVKENVQDRVQMRHFVIFWTRASSTDLQGTGLREVLLGRTPSPDFQQIIFQRSPTLALQVQNCVRFCVSTCSKVTLTPLWRI